MLFKYVVGAGFVTFAMLFSDFCNGHEIDFVNSLILGCVYYAIIIVVSAILYLLLGEKFKAFFEDEDLTPKEEITQSQNINDVIDDDRFEVCDVFTENSKVIGYFQDQEIFDIVDVKFKNGLTVKYKYFDTLHMNVEDIIHDILPAGALVVEKVIYVPAI